MSLSWGEGPKRKTPLKRTAIRRRKDAARLAAEYRRKYGSAERVHAVKAMPCAVCGETPSENAHVRGGGMGRKAGWQYVAPLCHYHHNERDNVLGSNEAMQDKYGVDLEAVALWLSKHIGEDG